LLLWRAEIDAAARWIRVAGTSVGLAGALLLIGSLALTLPHAGPILPIALIDFAALLAGGAVLSNSGGSPGCGHLFGDRLRRGFSFVERRRQPGECRMSRR
jgi:hypothetical protein